eukprot:2788278-Prymnesium_polylepis.2
MYGIPWRSNKVLEFDPSTKAIALLGSFTATNFTWHGGTLAKDGRIIAVPYNSPWVLEIGKPRREACCDDQSIAHASFSVRAAGLRTLSSHAAALVPRWPQASPFARPRSPSGRSCPTRLPSTRLGLWPPRPPRPPWAYRPLILPSSWRRQPSSCSPSRCRPPTS